MDGYGLQDLKIMVRALIIDGIGTERVAGEAR